MLEDPEESKETDQEGARACEEPKFPQMELPSERSGDGGSGLKEENRTHDYTVADDEDGPRKQQILVEVKINTLFLRTIIFIS